MYSKDFEQRLEESKKIREKYPMRIPIIIKRGDKCKNIDDIDKHKFLVPNDLTVGQFIFTIRKRIELTPEKALFLYVNNTMPPISSLILHVYEEHKNEDGFLYITYTSESTFGYKKMLF